MTPCSRCGHANPPRSRFCNECGAALGAASRPGSGAAPAAASDSGSGAAFAPASRPAPALYTPRHLAERILLSRSAMAGERKQITVLFADIKGSLELLAGRDPEDARRLLDPVLEQMMEAVHRYEGTVNQVMGDGIMALFGAPLAHEDHAPRACYAALRMQEALRRHADIARRDLGVDILMRVGLNSGDVVVRSVGSDLDMDYTAVGQTVHLAARMEQLAAPGTIVIAPATARLAEGYITVRPLGAREVKGLEAPVDLSELVGASVARSRLDVAVARGLTPFAARDAELLVLTGALGRVRQGHGEAVAIGGEAGLGKSRLLWEMAHTDRAAGFKVLEGRAVSYERGTAYLPVIEILRGCLGIAAGDGAARIDEAIDAHVAGPGEASDAHLAGPGEALRAARIPLRVLLDRPVEGDGAWAQLDPPDRRRHMRDAVIDLLLAESRRQPLLVIVEDLHWSDGETLALLDALVERLTEGPLLLVVTSRPEHRRAWVHLDWCRELQLGPLVPAGVGAMLAALLGPDASLGPLATALATRTEGNPLFLEESVRALEESGVLAGQRGAYRLARPLASVNVPATVSALLAERIDRLPPATKDILQAAAVIGRDVPAEVLVAVAGGSEAAVRGALGELCAAGLLHETAAFPEPIYAFTHGLAHEVAYGGLLLERRRHLHALALEALERRGRDGRAEPVERLARHAVLGEVRERAVGYLLDAGRRAAARSAFSEALEHLGTGLGLLVALPAGDARDRQELDLQLSLGRVAMASKGYTAPETERAYARARQLGQRVGDTRQVGPALAGQWAFHLLKARYPVARALAEQLLALAAEAGDPLLGAVAHRALGMTFLHEGTFARARQHLEQALAIYDPETHHERAVSEYGGDPHVACLAYLGRTLWFLGYPDQALARAREAVAQARVWSGALGVAQALGMLTSVHQTRRDMDDMREAIDRALAYASERGVSYWKARDVILASWVEAMSATGAGLRRSIERMRESLATYRGTETTLGLSWFTSLLAEPMAAAGDPDGGLAALDEALAHVADTGERFCEAEIHRLRGDLLIARGGAGAETSAEAAWRRALEIARSQQAQGWALRAATCLARLLARRGETRAARDVLGPIHGWFTEGFATADLRDAADVLAELDATVESYPGGVARRRSSSA